jgi:hypothetical protein
MLLPRVKRALRDKLGYRHTVEAWPIADIWDLESDCDEAADNKVPLEELNLRNGMSLDCYIYDKNGLVENIQVNIHSLAEIECLTTEQVIRKYNK